MSILSFITAELLFYTAFLLDLFIMYFGYVIFLESKNRLLSKVALFSSLSALVFGFHHLGEILFEGMNFGLEFSESLESFAVLLLLVATYYIYQMANEFYLKKAKTKIRSKKKK